MIPVVLYGHLRRRFGARFMLNVRTPAQAIRHLCGVLPGFKAYLQEHSAPGFHILVGLDSLGEDQLDYPASPRECIKIVPAVAGAGGKGLFQVVLGVALIAASLFIPSSWTYAAEIARTLGAVGMSLALGGIAQMLAPSPPKAADDTGTSFNGTDNVVAQGQTVPVTYGIYLDGSLVLSVGTSADTEFPTGSGGGPFGGVGSTWTQMSDAGDVSAWHNNGDGSAVPWVWNVDPET